MSSRPLRMIDVTHRLNEFSNGCIYNRHCNKRFEILFVLDGSALFEIEGEKYLVKKNYGIVIEPLRYQLVFGNHDTYERALIFFDLDQIPEEIRDDFIKRIKENVVFHIDELIPVFRKLVELRIGHDIKNQPLMDALFRIILYTLTFHQWSVPKIIQSKHAAILRKIVGYLDENMSKDIRMADVAEYVGMSQSMVYRLFQKGMKISMKRYILQKKMIYAQLLLRSGISPGAAAEACGYKNYASFYKVFIKEVGVAPGQLTDNGLIENDAEIR